MAYSYPEVGSHSVKMRCSSSWMLPGIAPFPGKTAQVQAGIMCSSIPSIKGASVATAMR